MINDGENEQWTRYKLQLRNIHKSIYLWLCQLIDT